MNDVLVSTSSATTRRAASFLIALAGLLVLVAPACSNSNAGSLAGAAQACHQNSDCASGLICALGACRAMCATSADCGNGGTCVNDGDVAVCQTAAEANMPCQKESDCPAPLACASDYRCRNLCTMSSDCNVLGVSGEVCAKDANGVDYCANPTDVTNGMLTAAPPPGAPTTGVIEPVIDASTSSGGSSGSSSGGSDATMGGSSGGEGGSSSGDATTSGSSGGSGEGGSGASDGGPSDAGVDAAPVCTPACSSSTVCVQTSSGPSCTSCGAQGGLCCSGQTCGANLTCLSSGVCECGSANESCCGGTTCNSGLSCSENDAGPSLCACGVVGTRCCPGTDGGSPSCTGGLACSGSNCTCIAKVEVTSNGYPTPGPGALVARVDGTMWTSQNGGAFVEVAGSSGPLVATAIGVSESPGDYGGAPPIGCGAVSGGVWCFPLFGSLTDSTDLGAGLGPTDTTSSTSPQQVLQSAGGGTPLTNIVQVSGGAAGVPGEGNNSGVADFCAVSSGGGAWCWGYGGSGQLGNGGTSSASVATPVMSNANNAMTNVAEVRLGEEAACARETDGSVWCWGTNGAGELGVPTGTLAHSYYPVQVPFTGTSAQTTSTGLVDSPYQTFCAVMEDTSVVCWGANPNSQAGAPVADAGSSVGPTQVLTAAGQVALMGITDLAANGTTAICAKNSNLAIVCWGSGTGFSGPYPMAYQNSHGTAAVDIVGPLSGGASGLNYVDPSGLLVGNNASYGSQPPCTNLL